MTRNLRLRPRFAVLLAGVLLALSSGALVMTQPLVEPRPRALPAADPERLKAHVIALSRDLPARGDDPDALSASADYLFRELSRYGKPRRETFRVAGLTYQNVALDLGPAAGERVVIGAHYDSDDGRPGADDNASGVAGVLELARLLGDIPLRRPVTLIAYALEEAPYFGSEMMGSAHDAAARSKRGEEVQLMLSLEMIGYFNDAPGSQTYPMPLLRALYPGAGNFIALAGDLDQIAVTRRAKAAMRGATDLPVESINAPEFVPGIDFSDHRNFWAHGYPALMVTDTAFYRNLAYHTDEDTWDRLDYRRMGEVVRGVLGIVLEFAG